MEIKIQIFHLQQKCKSLGINLTEDVQEIYIKNYKKKLQNIAVGIKGRKVLCLFFWKTQSCQNDNYFQIDQQIP